MIRRYVQRDLFDTLTEPATDAELQIITYTALGYTIPEIAEARGTQPSTIRTQREILARKYGLNTRLKVFLYALNINLISVHQVCDHTPGKPKDLTPRQLEVARYTALGYDMKKTGKALGVGFATIRTHREQAYDRLGFDNSVAMTAWALREKLITVEEIRAHA